jgi:hypothetical protein
MSRRSAKAVTINANVRCQRIYPVAGSSKTIEDLDTVGFKMSRTQAIDLARVLMAVTQDWEIIDVTGFRLKQRKSDGTFPITITSAG